ncbi:hypothetical protein Pelo_15103 [Pelomyxa schiedti]|nr:hypothetical protein Pelo_15103 [Pelomyxa schiedti]
MFTNVNGEREVQHHRLPNTPTGLQFGAIVFRSLGEFVKRAAGPLHLKNPLTPSPYHHHQTVWQDKLTKKRHQGFCPDSGECGNYAPLPTDHQSTSASASASAPTSTSPTSHASPSLQIDSVDSPSGLDLVGAIGKFIQGKKS